MSSITYIGKYNLVWKQKVTTKLILDLSVVRTCNNLKFVIFRKPTAPYDSWHVVPPYRT
jgi:hypothetical protein